MVEALLKECLPSLVSTLTVADELWLLKSSKENWKFCVIGGYSTAG